MSFRVNARKFALTYPRCEIEPQELLDFLKGVNYGDKMPNKIIVSHELHEDGTPHRHALVCYQSRVDCRDNRKYDYRNAHPNIQAVSNYPAWINYVKKDGNFVEWTSEENWHQVGLVNQAREMCEEDFLDWCLAKKIPYGYCDAARKLADAPVDWLTINEVNFSYVFGNEFSNYELMNDRTNIIVGPSGIGKTHWMKVNLPKPCLFVSHQDDLKYLRSYHKSVLFDDVSFSHLNRAYQIQVVDRQEPRSLHRRYGTTLIPRGVVVGITGNEDPVNLGDAAIRRRVNMIDIDMNRKPKVINIS